MPEGTIFFNKFQALKVRLVFLVVVAAALVMIVAGVNIASYWGLSPADGGVLRPLPQRLAFGGGVIVLALAMVAGMGFYVSRYVVSMRRVGDELYVSTANRFVGQGRKIAVDDVQSLDYRAGKTITHKAYINAPWRKMRIRGIKLPFIIDMQAEYIDKAGFDNLLASSRRRGV